MKPTRHTTSLACLAAAMLTLTVAARANDIAPFTTIFGTDWTYSGVGTMRDVGTGSISLAGVTGPVTQAYLYWHGPTDTDNPSANAGVVFNGIPIVGANIGLSSDNCWSYLNSQAYRADVTALVAGDGVYSLANFVKDAGRTNVNGVSLLVFFDDGNTANDRDVVLFDGNDSNIDNSYDAPGWNVSLTGINYSGGPASIMMGVSDGQAFDDGAVVLNGTDLAPTGPIFEGDSVAVGDGVDNNGGLWDLKAFDITSYLSLGPNALTLTSSAYNDCLSCVKVAIDLPAGAAPNPDVPEPGSLAMLFGAAAGLGGIAVRRRAR